ncbi:hypothetical protein P152DRAFT_299250 [Eremomyces bilateralis CBS 781.70]|uniref:Uncharacterized protein n=1 Tax=Eremomyces bilateralis CBS 781.70 TaxID=1392243 RepID=A0A6G1G7R0_9PEZI|nr:uncharacterized protein P152DRAFT_299250 [Eremomyces bilateralis CBS 781.70]KAF1813961.1 hypothetical protein P152DRAFT_299250 [Eremomyces bilateralis CBS 781.70]
MATPTTDPKLMSSRLMNMKFMQRATGTPPSTPAEPPSKRQRLSTCPTPSTPSSTYALPPSASRDQFLEHQAQFSGETQWVLSVAPREGGESGGEGGMKVRKVGFAAIDGEDGGEGREEDEEGEEGEVGEGEGVRTGRKKVAVGRRTYGNFQRKKEEKVCGHPILR